MATTEKISLTVPAHFKHAKVVRLTAAAIANSIPLNVIEVEDVRIAAEEGFVYAAETHGGSGDVDIAFTIDAENKELTMEFSLGSGLVKEDADEPAAAYAAFILGAVCDEYEITDGDAPTLRLVKHAENDDEAE